MSHTTDNCRRIIDLCRVANGTTPSGVTLTWSAAPGTTTPWSASAGGLTVTGHTEHEAVHSLLTTLRSKLTNQLAEAKAQAERIVEALEGGK